MRRQDMRDIDAAMADAHFDIQFTLAVSISDILKIPGLGILAPFTSLPRRTNMTNMMDMIHKLTNS
jgi:hypothetical protein